MEQQQNKNIELILQQKKSGKTRNLSLIYFFCFSRHIFFFSFTQFHTKYFQVVRYFFPMDSSFLTKKIKEKSDLKSFYNFFFIIIIIILELFWTFEIYKKRETKTTKMIQMEKNKEQQRQIDKKKKNRIR